MLIKVTQAHIDAGKQGSSWGCPVALAFQEQFPHSKIGVGNPHFHIEKFEGRFLNSVSTRIVCFDTKREMQPFEFEINYENQSNPSTH